MKRGWIVAATLAAGLASAPSLALPPVPMTEIVDTIRGLAADELGVKKSDVDLVRSLAAQGMSENELHALVVAINDEFAVVLPERDIADAKQNDPFRALSVLRLADMVAERMNPRYPE